MLQKRLGALSANNQSYELTHHAKRALTQQRMSMDAPFSRKNQSALHLPLYNESSYITLKLIPQIPYTWWSGSSTQAITCVNLCV